MPTYIYKLKNGVEICRSTAPIQFGDKWPQFQEIKPEKVEEPKSGKRSKEDE